MKRREFLGLGLCTLACLVGGARRAFAHSSGASRLVVLLLRGAWDGAAVLAPFDDPTLRALRAPLALPPGTGLPLIDGLSLHPALGSLHDAWRTGALLPLPATATGYRGRSHFDAQAQLEAGDEANESGWLNRLIGVLPAGARAVGLGNRVPLILRGRQPAEVLAPARVPSGDAETLARILALWQEEAAAAEAETLARAFEQRLDDGASGELRAFPARGGGRLVTETRRLARLMAREDGPVVGFLESGGWDTHAGQGSASGVLARKLETLNAALAALRQELASRWSRTVVLVLSEFGRTVASNGTGGTDHGTATSAFLLGGAIAGGRLIGEWPGVRPADLREGRDLRPTIELEAVLAAVVGELFELTPAQLREVMPGVTPSRLGSTLLRSA